MSIRKDIHTQLIEPVPHWLVLTLCWLFAILYGVWILPETVFIRHFCLVVGAILSLYVIYPNRRLLLKKEAAPIWLVVCLILWVSFHLFFIGRDFHGQWEEYTRIWKKIAVSAIFAAGLGIALISKSANLKHSTQYWRIVYFGFLLPAFTYFIKLSITLLGRRYGIEIPAYLVLDSDHMGSRFGVSRAWYLFFCLPAVALGIGMSSKLIKNKAFTLLNSFIYLSATPITLLIFYIENDRLGTFLGFTLILLTLIFVGHSLLKNRFFVSSTIFLLAITLSIFISYQSFKQSIQWHTLLADAKVAVEQVDQNNVWRTLDDNVEMWPINELGERSNNSNYLRISWAIVGIRYLVNNPLGYGLLSLSFGALDREYEKGSKLSWSHSALLDFALGYGIPGLLLLVVATLLAILNARNTIAPWSLIGLCLLPTLLAVLFVKEISSEIFINTFIFLIVLSASVSFKQNTITPP